MSVPDPGFSFYSGLHPPKHAPVTLLWSCSLLLTPNVPLFCLINGFLLKLWLSGSSPLSYFSSDFSVCLQLCTFSLHAFDKLSAAHPQSYLHPPCICPSDSNPLDASFTPFCPAPSHKHTCVYILYITPTILQWNFCLGFVASACFCCSYCMLSF